MSNNKKENEEINKNPLKDNNSYLALDDFYCLDYKDLLNNIKPQSIDLIFTSPPYNVGKDYDVGNDNKPYKDYLAFLKDAFRLARNVLKPDGRLVINVPSVSIWNPTYKRNDFKALYKDVIVMCEELGYVLRSDILWLKQAMFKRTAWGSYKSPSSPYVIPSYEFLLVFNKDAKNWKHLGKKEDIDITREEFIEFSDAIWRIKPETALSKYHPAPFPYDLAYRVIKFYTYQNDTVLDMFGGSGTVALVCKKNNRHFIYGDYSKTYTDFAKKRVLEGIVKGSQIENKKKKSIKNNEENKKEL